MSGYPAGSKDFSQLLPSSVGYGVVAGVGAFFAVLMIVISRLQKRFTQLDPDGASEFITASRSVKPGLICCGIVSAWTWSATLLQSSVATYASGLSAAWWYGVGGTVQIVFFAAVAAKVKQNANGAVTFLQIVKARYGKPCFFLFTFYALLCAHIVTGSLVLGASATINALTDANIIACNFLLPIGIAVYVVAGGLRATFLVDFLHTVILFIIIYIFMFTIYGTSDIIGSPGKLWDLLQDAVVRAPVEGNASGSYVTMKSNSGILFAGCTLASGFSGVFCDQGYWQRAIASRPDSTTRAYMLGGISWFAIPWAFGTMMGLSCRALMTTPAFPTYPYALSASQTSAGLVAPAAAVALLGTGGAVAVLIVVFMAATSACSAELIAVSSIVTFDVCGTVWKPLHGAQAVRVSHWAIAIFSVWAGAWSTILYYAHIDLGWLFYIQGVLLTPAVMPIAFTVLWKKQSKHAAFWGTITGTICGLIGWMLGCKQVYGAINITNLALPYSAISGAAPGLVISTIATVTITLIKPDNYDWTSTRAITIGPDKDTASEIVSNTLEVDETGGSGAGKNEKDLNDPSSVVLEVPTAGQLESLEGHNETEEPLDNSVLQRVFIRAAWFSAALSLVIAILIPIPMFAAHYVFSRRFFEVWVGLSIVWVLCAGGFCMVLPVWESRHQMSIITRSAIRVWKVAKK